MEHRRVGRLMQENGTAVRRNRKFKATTDSNYSFNIAANLLERTSRRIARTGNGLVTSASPIGLEPMAPQWATPDPRGMALPGCHPRSAFAARHGRAGEQPDETRSRDPDPEDGCCVEAAAEGLHPPYGSRQSVLFAWLSEDSAPARVQGIDERQGKLLGQRDHRDLLLDDQG